MQNTLRSWWLIFCGLIFLWIGTIFVHKSQNLVVEKKTYLQIIHPKVLQYMKVLSLTRMGTHTLITPIYILKLAGREKIQAAAGNRTQGHWLEPPALYHWATNTLRHPNSPLPALRVKVNPIPCTCSCWTKMLYNNNRGNIQWNNPKFRHWLDVAKISAYIVPLKSNIT